MEQVIPRKWSRAQKIVFRFFGSYLFIYIFPFPINLLFGRVFGEIGQLFYPFLSWVGRHFLHFDYNITIGPNGSGDTSYNYVQVFVFFWLAIFSCVIWSLLDRKRNDYNKVLYILKVIVRAYLAFYLIAYGFSKLPNGQFPHPGSWRLSQPIGESSPMGLAWTFLGFSTAFGMFMGFFEALGGILMIFRRTTLLGACIAAMVTCNIVMINFCFDVPVKLFSTHLLMMSVFLIVTDGKRFINFFFLNRWVASVPNNPVDKGTGWRITKILLKSAFGVYAIVALYGSILRSSEYYREKKSRVYGLYTIDEFVRNHKVIPPGTADSIRWKTMEISEKKSYITIVMMNGKKDFLNISMDRPYDSLKLFMVKDSITSNNMAVVKTNNTLTLKGIYLQDTFFIKMHAAGEKVFELTSRGFNWINEYPYNR